MAKVSGLGSSFYCGIYDISGDIGVIGGITTTQNVQDVSSIQTSGSERIGLRLDGSIAYNSFWNPSAGAGVPVLSAIAGPDLITVVKGPGGIGAETASLECVKIRFTTASGQDGSLGASGEAQGALGHPVEWGYLLTIGKQTFASTQAVSAWVALTDYALDDLVQPTTPNGHYYKATADTGSSDAVEPTWPTNGTSVVDDGITWTDQGLLPNGIDRGAGSASNFGAAAYLHAFSIGSGTANIKLQDSTDRVAWNDLPAAAFTAVTAATTQRVVTSATENVARYVRVLVTGTFTNLVAAVTVVPFKQ